MNKTTDHLAAWNKRSGILIAIANSGALAIVLTFAVSLLIVTPAFAQSGTKIQIEVAQNLNEELNDVAQEVQDALNEIGVETDINININEGDSDSHPKLGVYLSNMDFEDAYKMRYPYAHGVLVNGTVNNGAADKAGIIEDDIIMYFDGTKVRYEDHLVRLIRSKHFGDQVSIVFWRDEAIDSTVVTFVAPVGEKKETQLKMAEQNKENKKRKNSRGFGGGGFTPMLVQDEFANVDVIMANLGLNNTPFRTEGIVLWGGSGQGYVGNGWFLGGFGNAGGVSSFTSAIHSDGVTTAKRKVEFTMGFGGLTIEKRLAPFSWAVIGGGIGLGGGGMNLKVIQEDAGVFTWNWDTLNDQLIDTKSTTVNFTKAYAVAHPRVNIMIKLTPWMRLKAEYGQVYGYPLYSGWKATLEGRGIENEKDSFEIVDSPDTDLNARTISLGLWFGF